MDKKRRMISLQNISPNRWLQYFKGHCQNPAGCGYPGREKVQTGQWIGFSVLIDGNKPLWRVWEISLDLISSCFGSRKNRKSSNNPSASWRKWKWRINHIILKKEQKQGVNGNGRNGNWEWEHCGRKRPLPGIRPQYQGTPKINPFYFQHWTLERRTWIFSSGRIISNTKTLNKMSFVVRTYDDGTVDQSSNLNEIRTPYFPVNDSSWSGLAKFKRYQYAHHFRTFSGSEEK